MNLTRLLRGRESDPRWARPALLALLAATIVLYSWNLTASGWANSFYSAAVQAGATDWTAFLYGSLDGANSITVDKPPASLWVMALSVRLFGLSSFAILFPQVLMGAASVGVTYATVKRHFGAGAGLVAGVVLALTPVAALMFAFNNPDALLTLLMTLAAWATMRAVEAGSGRWFALAGVFIGLGFLTKTLQVLLVVPFLGIAYLVASPAPLRKRVVHSLMGVGAMVAAAGWWVAIVELVPASARPYIGGSQTNSFLELTFGYNGLGRLSGDETGSVGGARGWGETGWLRMFGSSVGDQVSWLIPSALLFLVVGLWLRGRRPRTDLRRAAYLVWGGWLLVTMAVFSFMAGIFHEYYTVALAPAIAALVGMGAAEAWERRRSLGGVLPLGGATLLAAVWAWYLLGGTAAYPGWLRWAVLAVGAAAAAALVLLNRLPVTAVRPVAVAGLAAALIAPAVFTASTTAQAHTGSIVFAGPAGSGMGGRGGPRILTMGPGGGPLNRAVIPGAPGQGAMPAPPPGAGGSVPGRLPGAQGGLGGLLDAAAPSTAIVAALSQDAEQYTWVAATVGSQSAAGLQLGTQLPVMAIGGFNGSDPSPTLEQLKQYVADGRIHYFAAGGRDGGMMRMGGGQMGGSTASSDIAAWVAENFESTTIDGVMFYDLTQPMAPSDGTASLT